MVINFFCSSSHSKGWMGRVLNCIKNDGTEWALQKWHKSRGECTINVNAFCVTSYSLIRSCLLLSAEGINRFLCRPYTLNKSAASDNTKMILLFMKCELESSSQLVLLYLSFLRLCLRNQQRWYQQRNMAVLMEYFTHNPSLFGTRNFFFHSLCHSFPSTDNRKSHRSCVLMLYLSKMLHLLSIFQLT